MKEPKRGMFARSLAGHDKGTLYIIMDVDERYVYLNDGRLKSAEKPKKKSRKHVQIDHHIAEVIREQMESGNPIREETIRKALKEKENKED